MTDAALSLPKYRIMNLFIFTWFTASNRGSFRSRDSVDSDPFKINRNRIASFRTYRYILFAAHHNNWCIQCTYTAMIALLAFFIWNRNRIYSGIVFQLLVHVQ